MNSLILSPVVFKALLHQDATSCAGLMAMNPHNRANVMDPL